ncbi:uncharacterized protein LOC109722949 [Ananas comosus]|uniref:Uncharacterized protein LOC109722949 n=1 Tax=Ananas comosus TaxID=4615 RepID=A0A6P5GMZ0_ANACO|nr:uncharacterized protein LOC109722949 [Ananas comosus]
MGCISSKLLATTADFDREIEFPTNENHVVSLTSTTYGLLNLERHEEKSALKEWRRSPHVFVVPQSKKRVSKEAAPEIINAWDLMKDLEEEAPIWSQKKKPAKPHVSIHLWSPAKAIVAASPKKPKRKTLGRENNNSPLQPSSEKSDLDSNRVLKPLNSSENSKCVGLSSTIPKRSTPLSASTPLSVSIHRSGNDSSVSSSRRSLSPLFDPELLASMERELLLFDEGEQIKKVVASEPGSRKAQESNLLLNSFELKCLPGGENSVVLYTTTLRGIRKTFEDCNAVRSTIESHDVRIVERDLSMDSGYREELRMLMGTREVKVPVLFVKGRLIGGAEEVLKLEEDGKMGVMLEGIERAKEWCKGCGGVRFVMCRDCNGSCKVLDEEEKKMVKCGECNENGLIHCPICCSV